MRDLAGFDGEPFDLVGTLVDAAESPCATQLAGGDGEDRRRHRPLQRLDRIPLCREIDIDASVGTIAGGEEWNPVDVVPVEMTEEYAALERGAVQGLCDGASSGAEVEDEGKGTVVPGDTDA